MAENAINHNKVYEIEEDTYGISLENNISTIEAIEHLPEPVSQNSFDFIEEVPAMKQNLPDHVKEKMTNQPPQYIHSTDPVPDFTFQSNLIDETSEPSIVKGTIFKIYTRTAKVGNYRQMYYEICDKAKNPLYKLIFARDGATFEDFNNEVILGHLQLDDRPPNIKYDLGLFTLGAHQIYVSLTLSRPDINTYQVEVLTSDSYITTFFWHSRPKGAWALTNPDHHSEPTNSNLKPNRRYKFNKSNSALATFEMPKKATKLGTLTFHEDLDLDLTVLFTMTISFVLHNHGKKHFLK